MSLEIWSMTYDEDNFKLSYIYDSDIINVRCYRIVKNRTLHNMNSKLFKLMTAEMTMISILNIFNVI